MPMPMRQKVPVTVLTGFLGSGKTTLLNRILSEDHGLKIAVIENEFGEIGIDQDLVINADEEIFEMNNGCICCNVRGDLIRILGSLAHRGDKFDCVILETTGMANPGPVAQTFFVQDDIKEFYELDGIITLVDAKHVVQHLDDGTEEVLTQVAFADRMILNKIDLVTDEEQAQVKSRLQSINSLAEIYTATMADAPIAELLDIGGFNLQRAVEVKPDFLAPEYPFEWAGLWQLAAGDYRLNMSAEHNSEQSIVMTTAGAGGESDLSALAEGVFVEFSAPSESLQHGQAIAKSGQHYQLQLTGSDANAFEFTVPADQAVAFFTEHAPKQSGLKLVAANDAEQSVQVEHTFSGEHAHHDHDHDHDHGHDHHHHHHSDVGSVSVEMQGLMDSTKFMDWIGTYLEEHGEQLYRLKGIVGLEGEASRMVFQGVHMSFDSFAGKPWGDEAPYNRIVFIGKELDEAYLRKSLQDCLV